MAAVRQRSSVPRLVLAWTALLAAAIPMAFGRLVPLLNIPATQVGNRIYVQQDLKSVATLSSGEPAYVLGVVVDVVRDLNGSIKSGSVSIWSQADPQNYGSLSVDAVSGSYQVLGRDGSVVAKGNTVDAAAVRSLFEASGNTEGPTDAEAADLQLVVAGYLKDPHEFSLDLYRSAHNMVANPLPLRAIEYAGGGSNGPLGEPVFADPALSPNTVVMMFWTTSTLIYLIGLAVLLWMRHRLVRLATPGAS